MTRWLLMMVGLLGAMPAWAAGTGHYYVPASAMRCLTTNGSDCTNQVMGTESEPVKQLANPTGSSASLNAVFWFPESHESTCSGGCKFTVVVHYLNGASGTQSYATNVGIAFIKNSYAWGNGQGDEGTMKLASNSSAVGQYAKSSMTASDIVSYDSGAAAACTHTECKNQPGNLYIERTTDDSSAVMYIVGADIYWTTP